MPTPSKAWVVISDSQVDADSPLDTTLITGLRDDVVHIREWLGKDYTAATNHKHDGVDSAQISYADIPKTVGVEIFDDFLLATIDARWAADAYTAISTIAACGCIEIIVPGNTMGGIFASGAKDNFNLTNSNTLTYEARRKCASGAALSLAPLYGFTDNNSNGPWNGNQMVFTSNTGTNWLAKTVSAGVDTTTDTGVAVAATSWQKLKIKATATSVKFYIDDVLKVTHTTNIPATASMSPVAFEYRVTSGATFYVDYIYVSGTVRNN